MIESTTIILFTGYYPFNEMREYPFLNPEIEHICSVFDRVIVVPEILDGDIVKIPRKVEVEKSFGRKGKSLSYVFSILGNALTSPLFWNGIFIRPQTVFQLSAAIRLLRTVGRAKKIEKWVRTFINKNNINLERTIFYTYWLEAATLGIGLVKKSIYPKIRLISRGHGFDIYENRHNPPYFPCRIETLEKLDRLFLISKNGRDHISTRFPWFSERCEVSRLGVQQPGFLNSASKDGIIRIVSCSFIGDVKRVDLLLMGLIKLAENNPQQTFKWNHIGDGPMYGIIQNLILQAPENLECQLLGQFTNSEVLSFYQKNSIDLFVNVSSSEGIPVSIMEAISCGIPVIATSVGGIPEIISENCGFLLSPNPTPQDISNAIWKFVCNPDLVVKKRSESYRVWMDEYDANINYSNFCKRILSLLD